MRDKAAAGREVSPPRRASITQTFHGFDSIPNFLSLPRQVEIRPMMYVALTYDHRLVDGREAVTFLRKIKAVVEDPRVLLLDM